MKTQKLTFSALLIAIGTLAGHLIYIPIGVAKCFPVQHTINVLSAVLLGPGYAVSNAFCISLLRNFTGSGSPLAFPGSMIGAFFAGFLFYKTRKYIFAVTGEIFGTGVLGALACYPIAKYFLGREVAVFFFIGPFLLSTIAGSLIGYALIKIMSKSSSLQKFTLSK
ncbi:energy coupling factor transporter S component ThiW [Desulfonispora thiosulfatigenes DSM 11270]|uniref:Energy coupling factor transporter S component ThiW n=1 Tax=Desulfonispora thiosulfatigenes DSM 11270 TaxID=656914 RepID=A0A1W1V1A4_DESTI|nr:energy coupling factor transporter S component ThiW [Desulfonispora thiosulfatigenes]SMB86794.1 energy coupling factor transporter S component ThiW [Desulfonispora thiosulfatigenes DSM 11270]